MSKNLNEDQARAVLIMLHKVMSDHEHEMNPIKPNDLIKAFNSLSEETLSPDVLAGAWSLVMGVIASTNQDNTEFLRKMHAILELS